MLSTLWASQSDNFTYTDSGTSITITDYPTSAVGDIEVPSIIAGKPVTNIGASAFSGCAGLTNVTIPSTVTSIGNQAFQSCTGLASISISSNVTSIGNMALYGCTGLTNIVVDALNPSYSSASGVLFNKSQTMLVQYPPGRVGSYVIPSSVTSIVNYSFENCGGLISVRIPSSVSSVGASIFRGCTGLTSIDVDTLNPSYSSSSGVLFNKNQTLLIRYPSGKVGNYTVPSSVIAIDSEAFRGSVSLTEVSIPNNVTSIKMYAFYGCAGLSSITIPSSVTSIEIYTFAGCAGLTSVAIPLGVTNIGASAFSGCAGLTNVTIPSTVTNIESSAFNGCAGLTSVTIPSSVTSIGASAYSGCTGLTNIVVDALNPSYSSASGVLFNKSQTMLVQYPPGRVGSYVIPSSVTTLKNSAFYGCVNLTEVTIPTNVTSLGNYAFYGCSGLTSVTIPSGVTSVGSFTFDSCTGLENVTIPSGVKIIETRAFHGCSSLSSVTIPSSVTSIGALAFYDCRKLTSVTIPSSVTSIGSLAFQSCTGLKDIVVDTLNPSYSSLTGILFNKNQTLLIQFPLGRAGSYTIPSSVTSIGSSAFYRCTGLSGIEIPSSVTSIGNSAFYGCSSLTFACFTGDAPSIGSIAFFSVGNGFTVYYFDGKKGFTSPSWNTYVSVNMGMPTPFPPWLLTNGFAYDTNLQSDPNGDGVNLLMAYALNLNPNLNLSGDMPKPVYTANQISFSFYAGSEGINYSVETSTDLLSWSTDGVTVYAPDEKYVCTAIMNITSQNRFMRLVVSN
jgi:hypothetical protein